MVRYRIGTLTALTFALRVDYRIGVEFVSEALFIFCNWVFRIPNKIFLTLLISEKRHFKC
jgi:hypothetical protein